MKIKFTRCDYDFISSEFYVSNANVPTAMGGNYLKNMLKNSTAEIDLSVNDRSKQVKDESVFVDTLEILPSATPISLDIRSEEKFSADVGEWIKIDGCTFKAAYHNSKISSSFCEKMING